MQTGDSIAIIFDSIPELKFVLDLVAQSAFLHYRLSQCIQVSTMKDRKITFKKIDETDLKLLHQWFQIPHVLKWYARDKKYTLKMIKEKYLPRINNSSIPNFIICDNDRYVGYIQLYHVTDHFPEGIVDLNHILFDKFMPNEIAGIDLFIADESYLHIGFSSEALSKFINTHIKGKFKAVLVDPVKQNIHAIAFFERNNFRHIMTQDSNYDLMLNDNF